MSQRRHRERDNTNGGPQARLQVKAAEVAAELLPGTSVELLKELHLLTRDGDLNADSRRKLKQVNHLIGFLRPVVDDVLARSTDPLLVDCGAGKSYLGFLVYQIILGPAGRGRLIMVESRKELADAATERARALGMTRLQVVHASIAHAELPPRVSVVTALHACDTATDEALALAIRHQADHVAVVPCCQAEVAKQLAGARPTNPGIAALFAHPWHRREMGSHLTNVVRTLALEAVGYKVTVTELAGWEHSLKNELILGKRVRREDTEARARLDALLAAFDVEPSLVHELRAAAGTASDDAAK
jgi:hypothetical protein